MNALNRVLAVVFLLVMIALLIGALAAMFGYDYGFMGNYLQEIRNYLNELSGWQVVAGAAATIILILIFLGIIVLEIPRENPEDSAFLLSSDDSGTVTINRESLEKFAESVGLEFAQVLDIHCRIGKGEDGFKVRCEPLLLSGTNVKDQAPQLQERVRNAVESSTGVPVSNVVIRAKYESPDKQAAEQVIP